MVYLYDNVRIHYQKQTLFPCYKTEGFKTSVMYFPGAPTLNLGAKKPVPPCFLALHRDMSHDHDGNEVYRGVKFDCVLHSR